MVFFNTSSLTLDLYCWLTRNSLQLTNTYEYSLIYPFKQRWALKTIKQFLEFTTFVFNFKSASAWAELLICDVGKTATRDKTYWDKTFRERRYRPKNLSETNKKNKHRRQNVLADNADIGAKSISRQYITSGQNVLADNTVHRDKTF
jgi:hypothetical protein